MSEKLDEKTTVAQLKKKIARFSEERDWSKYHRPKDLAMSISIEAGELLENFQWLTDEEIENFSKDPKRLQRIKSELADVFVYALNLSNKLDIDVSRALFDKIKENEQKYPIGKIKGDYKKYSEIE